jgi:hypothetical protein
MTRRRGERKSRPRRNFASCCVLANVSFDVFAVEPVIAQVNNEADAGAMNVTSPLGHGLP